MNRVDLINKFYDLLWEAEQAFGTWSFEKVRDHQKRREFFNAGVYFAFEEGELRAGRSDWGRVTRIGSHWVAEASENSKANLYRRLMQHYGRADGRGGASSIWRVHVGSALTGKAEWWLDSNREILSADKIEYIHGLISDYLREKIAFVFLPIGDKPSKTSMRATIERGAISLLSNYRGKIAIDPPSKNWIGRKCITLNKHDLVSKSGLWNVNHVLDDHSDDFIKDFKECLKTAKSQR